MVGMSEHHTDAHVARAVYEGVVYSHLTHIDALMKSLKKPRCVRLAGGVTHSAVWSQMFADAIGLDIEVMGDTELGAKGAAMAAGVGCGLFKNLSDVISHCVEEGKILKPDMNRHTVYREKYQQYKAVSDALDPIWKKI